MISRSPKLPLARFCLSFAIFMSRRGGKNRLETGGVRELWAFGVVAKPVILGFGCASFASPSLLLGLQISRMS